MKPKKSLGQNFLRDEVILNKIIKSANISADDFVIEVGPGEGVLTKELVKYAKKVIAIEIDKNLADKLDSRFCGNDAIEIINADILKVNLPELISKLQSIISDPVKDNDPNYQLQITNYKVIANIPYYITSPIIQLFLETKYPPKEMILMVQKEVGERICARPGDMSILAVSVQYYATPELLFNVPRTAFYPAPEVDSAVIRIKCDKRQETRDKEQTKKFFRVVKAGFAAKRKTLVNNLSSSLHLEKSQVEEVLKKAGIDPGARAQELSVGDWEKLSKEF